MSECLTCETAFCKKARKDRNYQVVAETNPDDVVVADEADAENN